MLQCCEADGEHVTVLEFFAVGKTFRALLLCAVKGGMACLKLNNLQLSRFVKAFFYRLDFFIGYFTLSRSYTTLNCTIYNISCTSSYCDIILLLFNFSNLHISIFIIQKVNFPLLVYRLANLVNFYNYSSLQNPVGGGD